ncbi:hypothetical protein GW943_01660 [Candidatus Parcubacteria bacterium]|uniref:DUF5667 domain-containing protein n=1 Tax=Candidatus Kaiserbacteria bacterium CG10_big_fil_rev_8_21_14_0_10_47_16 TaxID=1974608 RepID=A0A2H0UEA1_9BACT|nr:hypothetical protein [Candidatus Parcubacteria bacterium]PIR84739.1 MAG: hypothetical protein COU16_00955 [Candidatus Kaiserbacteria bacterium CG10_big_fil_rev_8_21_14_0_10_47_16]
MNSGQNIVERIIGKIRRAFSGTGTGNDPQNGMYTAPRSGGRLRKVLLAILVVIIVLIVIGFLGVRSIPGSIFYGIKVNVVEPAMQGLQVSTHEKAAYQIKLMQRRLDELTRLNPDKPMSDKTREVIQNQLARNTDDLRSIIETNENITQGEAMTTLHDAAVILELQENEIAENPNLESLDDAAIERLRSINETYKGFVLVFVAGTDAETLQAYVNDQLDVLLKAIKRENPDENTAAKVNKRLQNIKEALIDNDAAEAIYQVHEALQILDSAKYYQ